MTRAKRADESCSSKGVVDGGCGVLFLIGNDVLTMKYRNDHKGDHFDGSSST